MIRFVTIVGLLFIASAAHAETGSSKLDGIRNDVRRDMVVIDRCLANVNDCIPAAKAFVDMLDFAHDRRGVGRVNRSVNMTIKYIPDIVDQWQSPLLTLERGAGDCEDFAILKIVLLHYSGFNKNDLVLMVDIDHATAQVNIDGEFVMLDNRSLFIFPGTTARFMLSLF